MLLEILLAHVVGKELDGPRREIVWWTHHQLYSSEKVQESSTIFY